MGKLALTPEVLVLIAERFKALAEPARLRILSCLGGGELTVSELVGETELGQANVSKHLQLLHAMGFVTRRRDGLFVHYSLADRRHEAKGRRRMGPRDITVHGECEPAVGLLRRKYGSTGRWRVAPFAHEVHWEREHSYQSNQEHNAGHRRLPRRNARMS